MANNDAMYFDEGTDLELGKFDIEVANGLGFYDEDGWYHRYEGDSYPWY